MQTLESGRTILWTIGQMLSKQFWNRNHNQGLILMGRCTYIFIIFCCHHTKRKSLIAWVTRPWFCENSETMKTSSEKCRFSGSGSYICLRYSVVRLSQELVNCVDGFHGVQFTGRLFCLLKNLISNFFCTLQ